MLLNSGGVRKSPSKRPLVLFPRCVKFPRVSAYEKLPPRVMPSVSRCDALSRTVARLKKLFGPTNTPSLWL